MNFKFKKKISPHSKNLLRKRKPFVVLAPLDRRKQPVRVTGVLLSSKIELA